MINALVFVEFKTLIGDKVIHSTKLLKEMTLSFLPKSKDEIDFYSLRGLHQWTLVVERVKQAIWVSGGDTKHGVRIDLKRDFYQFEDSEDFQHRCEDKDNPGKGTCTYDIYESLGFKTLDSFNQHFKSEDS